MKKYRVRTGYFSPDIYWLQEKVVWWWIDIDCFSTQEDAINAIPKEETNKRYRKKVVWESHDPGYY